MTLAITAMLVPNLLHLALLLLKYVKFVKALLPSCLKQIFFCATGSIINEEQGDDRIGAFVHRACVSIDVFSLLLNLGVLLGSL